MITKQQLMDSARKALENSFCPYSKFKIGSAICTIDGKIFSGCNIENVSLGLTICAERVALFKAISEGFIKFESIAITSVNNKSIFPCGACRQVLSEFAPNLKIYVNNDDKIYYLMNLLPNMFNSIN